jgi:hypothetical protein
VRKTEIKPPGVAGTVGVVEAGGGPGTTTVVVVGATVAGLVVDGDGLGAVVT